MRVDKSKMWTPEEELAYLWKQLLNLPDFIPWDVHPNVLRASNIREARLHKKVEQARKRVALEEQMEYTSSAHDDVCLIV